MAITSVSSAERRVSAFLGTTRERRGHTLAQQRELILVELDRAREQVHRRQSAVQDELARSRSGCVARRAALEPARREREVIEQRERSRGECRQVQRRRPQGDERVEVRLFPRLVFSSFVVSGGAGNERTRARGTDSDGSASTSRRLNAPPDRSSRIWPGSILSQTGSASNSSTPAVPRSGWRTCRARRRAWCGARTRARTSCSRTTTTTDRAVGPAPALLRREMAREGTREVQSRGAPSSGLLLGVSGAGSES